MIDQEDKPARTMLTSEGGFSRTTHIVKDKMTGRVRLLTATEAERIQAFLLIIQNIVWLREKQ